MLNFHSQAVRMVELRFEKSSISFIDNASLFESVLSNIHYCIDHLNKNIILNICCVEFILRKSKEIYLTYSQKFFIFVDSDFTFW